MTLQAFVLLVFLFLGGCVPHPGVVQIGAEKFMVSRHADKDISGLSTLRGEALEEAYQYCISQNRFMRVVGITEFLPPDISRGRPRVEVQFMCLMEADPRLTRPSLEDSPDAVRIILE